MILPDLSLLIHAYNRESRVHTEAKLWWRSFDSGPSLVMRVRSLPLVKKSK